ncbi:MAG: hypothetical protein IPN85_10080 [Flavobacteriales bacterium]|nr:hypothetical protein [Flavobacteriales bacterium]
MMLLLARRTLLLMALAMGISLVVPNVNWNEVASRTVLPMSEEETHPVHGVIAWQEAHGLWRYAALQCDPARSGRSATHLQVLPEDPILDVIVPPPEARSALS